MKIFITILLLTFSNTILAGYDSGYTSVKTEDCISQFSSEEDMSEIDFYSAICPSFAGYQVEISGGDIRYDLKLNYNGTKIKTEDGTRCMYPWLPFWELAREYDIKVIANSDAHRPQDVSSNIAEATQIGQNLGLAFADLSHLEQ